MLLLNVPVPDVVQVLLAALPPRVPERVWVLPKHIVASTPALTVAIGLIVNTIASFTAEQGPAPSGSLVVIVKVTVLAVMSAAEGV